MFVKIFESSSTLELESQINEYIKSDETNGFDLHSIVQSESMAEVNGKLERKVTMTCIFGDSFYQEDFDEEEI